MSAGTRPPTQSDDARCNELQQLLLRSQRTDDALPDDLETHFSRCPSCQAFRAELVTLDALTREQAPELPEGFQLDLRRRLNEVEKSEAATAVEEASPDATRRSGLMRAALAAAALVLIVAGALLAASWLGGPKEPVATFHRLKLSIQSAQAFDEVLFDVELPEGVRLLPATGAVIGRGKTLRWRSSVRQGLNRFDLPLAARSATGRVKVRLRAGSRIWRGTVPLDGGAGAASAGAEAQGDVHLAWVLDADPTATATGGAR
jgi:hypothetical protein